MSCLARWESPRPLTHQRSLIGRQFDDERILGPYSEAIDTLPEAQRLTLCAMAVRAPQPSIGYDWAVKLLAEGIERADDFTRKVITNVVRIVQEDNMVREEAVAGHLHALRAWARICDTLPEAAPTPKNQHEALLMVAWRCVDELLLDLFRDTDTGPERRHLEGPALRCAGGAGHRCFRGGGPRGNDGPPSR
ncbi:hypothetical protein [Mycobacterium sp.]|uniref:hypothetical protein n=1 Tax=Mycobacterium sp. TaxID=1785 RepID=UPI003C779309